MPRLSLKKKMDTSGKCCASSASMMPIASKGLVRLYASGSSNADSPLSNGKRRRKAAGEADDKGHDRSNPWVEASLAPVPLVTEDAVWSGQVSRFSQCLGPTRKEVSDFIKELP